MSCCVFIRVYVKKIVLVKQKSLKIVLKIIKIISCTYSSIQSQVYFSSLYKNFKLKCCLLFPDRIFINREFFETIFLSNWCMRKIFLFLVLHNNWQKREMYLIVGFLLFFILIFLLTLRCLLWTQICYLVSNIRILTCWYNVLLSIVTYFELFVLSRNKMLRNSNNYEHFNSPDNK